MKYAIYDKAADGYLTKMEFEVGYSEHTQFECGYNEYITEARLLDTPKEAADAIVRIESCKFMEKGRFVIHSFDDTLKDQYIISEAGEPTKVVDNITVDLDGTINVKYGTMALHWSTASLDYAINRMNALQKAKSPKYTSWCNTFDIYKVITIMDEKSCTHYQFIKVTNKGLTEYAKNEVDPLNKRIEELEKANYDLGQTATARGIAANRLQEENDNLKTKVESIKKEVRDWKNLYENADRERNVLKNVIDNIYDDLHSSDMCKDLRETYDYVKSFSELHNIKIHNDDDDTGMPIYITANVEFRCIIDKIIAIIESRDLNQRIAFSSAEEIPKAIAKAQKAEKALDDQLELSHGVCDENRKLRVERDCTASIIHAIRNAITDCNTDAFDCIESRIIHDSDFNSDPFMAGVRENVKDICTAEKRNVANHDLKNSEIARLTEERDKALELNEKYKNRLNSIYGYYDTDDAAINYCMHDIIITGRCCGKQVMADILSGKKIPISKDKYDSILTSLKLIDLSYEGVYGTNIRILPKPKPTWLPGLLIEFKDLTK